jgi:hypothetical protein
MTTATSDRDIVETSNKSWRFKTEAEGTLLRTK